MTTDTAAPDTDAPSPTGEDVFREAVRLANERGLNVYVSLSSLDRDEFLKMLVDYQPEWASTTERLNLSNATFGSDDLVAVVESVVMGIAVVAMADSYRRIRPSSD
jgi:hypothetical protein